MLPLELKSDKNGLLYMEDKTIIKRISLPIDKRIVDERYYQNSFYRINSTDDYIIKYSHTPFMKKEREKIMAMLEQLVIRQKQVPDVDFPIGYFRRWHKLAGLIVRYYPNGISFDNIVVNGDIEGFGKYYYHDEDSIHNLFLFFYNVLDIVYEMFENEIYYGDINHGNIVLTDNKVKIIDFDYRFVHFDNKDKNLAAIMYAYDRLLRETLMKYNIDYGSL